MLDSPDRDAEPRLELAFRAEVIATTLESFHFLLHNMSVGSSVSSPVRGHSCGHAGCFVEQFY